MEELKLHFTPEEINEKNYEEAFKYFKMSADSNNTNSFYYLGRMYFDGNGTSKNYTKALNMFMDAMRTHKEIALMCSLSLEEVKGLTAEV